MPAPAVGTRPSLRTFLYNLKHSDNVESSIALLVSLLKFRQIAHSRPCAIATTRLLLQVVAARRWSSSKDLERRIREVGERLQAAQPREMAVGNIVRRVLGIVHEVAEDDQDTTSTNDSQELPASPAVNTGVSTHRPKLPTNISEFSPLHQGAALPHSAQPHASSAASSPSINGTTESPPRRPALTAVASSYAGQGPHGSLFGILTQPQGLASIGGSPPDSGTTTPVPKSAKNQDESKEKLDIKAEVIDGIKDLLEELDIVDSQISEYALDHIHSNEIILTHTSSQTVQRFLSAAARKRKFTVIHAEAYPNNHEETHSTVINGSQKAGEDEDPNERWKTLTSMGIKVIVIPDSAVFALMSRVNKVIMAPHAVLANGSLIAAAGASTIAQAAKAHQVPVVVLSGVYKLSPVYPFDMSEMIEYGDPGKVVPFQDGPFMDKVDVINPLFDWVDADLVNLYITNLGAHAPSYLYRIVADHYRTEDIDLTAKVQEN
ncbi:hypothetical protein DOTSEDRAFT_72061 [Dothistroma septosporum NZE10]|uniref:Translation initiation factor eIF2B subunit beta n=1 Tax=Dothistroma septosporum (strain NZE10 / CBS 128990) TaxID=675120 RepID=N1PM75_DOTSN|nr:hypothetical protein DOTSEDRAFT_72061 [Dothistroma septosporum NZE10]